MGRLFSNHQRWFLVDVRGFPMNATQFCIVDVWLFVFCYIRYATERLSNSDGEIQ